MGQCKERTTFPLTPFRFACRHAAELGHAGLPLDRLFLVPLELREAVGEVGEKPLQVGGTSCKGEGWGAQGRVIKRLTFPAGSVLGNA